MRLTKIEITPDEMKRDDNWAGVFGEDGGENTTDSVSVAPPESSVSTAPVKRALIKQVIAAADNEGDFAEWDGLCLVLLHDGRYVVASGGCDTTGWDCRAQNTLIVCATLPDALRFGLTSDERVTLGLPEPASAVEAARRVVVNLSLQVNALRQQVNEAEHKLASLRTLLEQSSEDLESARILLANRELEMK